MSNTKRAVSRLLFAVVLTIPIRMLAQNVSETNRPTSDGGGNPDQITTPTGQSNAAVLEELSRMRARIQELESQLKAQSGGTTDSSTQPAQLPLQNASLAAPTSLLQVQQPSAEKGAPA